MKVDKKDLFIKKIQDMFGNKHVRIMQHMYSRPPTTFRVNKTKANESEVLIELKKIGFQIAKGPIPNSYIVQESPKDIKLSSTDLFDAGKVYIQRLSSMLPAIMLDLEKGQKVLDMCAAPGSKTSQIADLTNQETEIVAIDNNKKRIYKFKDNLATQGIENVEIFHANAAGFERRHPRFINYFDRVLLDAPCSNESLICLSDSDAFEYWNPKAPKKLSKLQKKLASSAVHMLKPGGIFVYSTCTFSKEENEDVVAWILKKFSNLSLLEVKKVIPDGVFTGFFASKFKKMG